MKQLMISTNSYMFLALESHLQGFPKDGTLVLKHVEVGSYHKLCCMICYFIAFN
jgi:hypothetical protein